MTLVAIFTFFRFPVIFKEVSLPPGELDKQMDHLKEQIKKWETLLDKIHRYLIESSKKGRGYSKNDIREYTAYTIKHSLFFSFNAIMTLLRHALYFYSFSLLRSLFESHITLWRICNNDIEIAKDFIRRAQIANHNISVAINIDLKESYNAYYDETLLKPIDLENGYWDKPLTEIIEIIDKMEEDSWPYHALMYLRLYSAGSEFLHPSSFSINESILIKDNNDGKQTIVFDPNLGIESAWWSAIIILDSEKWYHNLLGEEYDLELVDLKKQAMNLASKWPKRRIEN